MTALAEDTLLYAWESGLGQHPMTRALTVLAIASPRTPQEALAVMTIGERDGQLLATRIATFGRRASGQVACPACNEQLELDIDLTEIAVPPQAGAAGLLHHLRHGAFDVRFRLPTTPDLQVIAACREVAEAYRVLVRRCVIEATRDGVELAADDLPKGVITALASAMSARDPRAEVRLDLTCPSCGKQWQAPFDIEVFFWIEIQTHARRLLRDVHTLAAAYHWREADILAMSAARRQRYLEMVHDG